MSRGFGSKSIKRKKTVKEYFLQNKFEKGLKYLAESKYKKAKLILSELEELGYKNKRLNWSLAEIYFKENDFIGAIKFIENLLKKRTIDIKLISLLGYSYINVGELNKGRDLLKKVLHEVKNNNEKFNLVYDLILNSKQNDISIEFIENALKNNHQNENLYFNLGSIFFAEANYDLAIDNYLKGINLNSNNEYAYSNLAGIYEEKRDYKQAVENYKKAYFLNKNLLQVREKLIALPPKIGDWSFFKLYKNWEDDFIKNKEFKGEPLSLISLDSNPEKELALAKLFYNLNYKSPREITLKKNNNQRIKVGYFSADFRIHPVSILLARILELHCKDTFEIYGFSFSEIEDNMTDRLKKVFDKYINISNKDDNECINLIRKENLDIAIDLMGYTTNARVNLFSNRISPTQINFLGYPGTSGSEVMDYLISDENVIPRNSQKFYSEKILYMPSIFMPFDDTLSSKEIDVSREKYDLPSEKFILAGFHRIEKINPNVIDVWSKILIKIENSILWLQEPSEISKFNIISEFERRKVDKNKIYFAKRTKTLSEHISRHKLADISLDTFFYSSHSTGLLSLWAGLPVVTLQGENFASRVVASFLKNLSMTQLIAHNEDHYISIVCDLYKSKSILRELKIKLLNEKNKNKIFDSTFFVKELEKLYLSIL